MRPKPSHSLRCYMKHRDCNRVLRWSDALATVALLVAATPWPLHAQQNSSPPDSAVTQERLEREYAEPFRRQGLIPVFLPRGQAPGDVLAPGGEFLYRGDECFTGLSPREAGSRLPGIELTWTAAARFALGAEGIADAETHGK